ncbi:MAG TPA: carbohydrate ABC transporter permease [Herpetosiphonaceae bacterium]
MNSKSISGGQRQAREQERARAERRSALGRRLAPVAIHGVLLLYTLIAMAPVILVVMNSFKDSKEIFAHPYLPPFGATFEPVGYETVFGQSQVARYFINSFLVTSLSISLVLLFGAMASFALTEYAFPGNTPLGIYLLLGLMIPIRLATVSILKLMVFLGLQNTIWSLILVYIAQGLPFAVFVLTQYMRQVPKELKDAARIDGANEYQIFFLVAPLLRPALATLAVFIMIPIWNDLWFPLILAPGEASRTLTLGAQQFLGQFQTDWSALLAMLTLAIVPVLLLYVIFSRQLIRGLTAGAIKS